MTLATGIPMENTSEVQNHTRIDKMDRHRLARRLLRPIPYSLGARVFALFWTLPGTYRLASYLCGPFRRLTRYLDIGVTSATKLRVFIQVNFLSHWRLHALGVASEQVFNNYVTFKNLALLNRYYGDRGIVLCNSHFGGGKLVGVLLARKGYNLISLDRVNSYSFLPKVDWAARLECLAMGPREERTFLLKSLFKCQKALRKKSMVQIIADGYRGKSSVMVNFLGKQRAIRSSFAELAVDTGAVIIPVLSRIDQDGHVEVELFPPMDPQAMNGSDAEKVTQLCQTYAAWLADAWQAEPANVFKNDIELFLRLPAAREQLLETSQHVQS